MFEAFEALAGWMNTVPTNCWMIKMGPTLMEDGVWAAGNPQVGKEIDAGGFVMRSIVSFRDGRRCANRNGMLPSSL
jgi:hypothetical protein